MVKKGMAKRTGGDPRFGKKNVAQLRKEAAVKKRRNCPPLKKMKRAELIRFLKK
jgi:hypothetical protein|tara:strand:- start:5468 stop:5629 length:162 start_codon:yes stop_codon:yes gene_type:complete